MLQVSEDTCSKSKTMVLVGSVDDDMLKKALKDLHVLNKTTGTITIYLSTKGGDVDVARGIYDAIKASPNLVEIVCYGLVASAGTIILMAADFRTMTINSKIMLHIGEEGLSMTHPRNADATIANFRSDETFIEDVYLERINEKNRRDRKKLATREEMKELLTWDTYMNPKEAKTLGLINKIKSNDVEIN